MSNPWKPSNSPLLEIDTLRSIQIDLNLMDNHIVHIGRSGFSIAHTQSERQRPQDLIDCAIHKNLEACNAPPRETGIWVVDVVTEYSDFDYHPYTSYNWVKLEEKLSNNG